MPLTLQGLFRFTRAERGGGSNTQMRSRKHTITVKTAHPSSPRFDSETEWKALFPHRSPCTHTKVCSIENTTETDWLAAGGNRYKYPGKQQPVNAIWPRQSPGHYLTCFSRYLKMQLQGTQQSQSQGPQLQLIPMILLKRKRILTQQGWGREDNFPTHKHRPVSKLKTTEKVKRVTEKCLED